MNITYQPASSGTTYHNDAGSGKDAGSSRSRAILISEGSITGRLASNDTTDYYKVLLPPERNLNITLIVPPDSNFNLVLYNSRGTQKAKSFNGTGAPESINYTVNNIYDYTTWYIKVNRSSGAGNYTLKVTYSYPIQNVAGGASTETDTDTTEQGVGPVSYLILILFVGGIFAGIISIGLVKAHHQKQKKTIKILVPEKKVTLYSNGIKITEEL